MVLNQVTDILSKRRSELVNILESRSESIQLEKQHQIYGAINEIDLFLQTISYLEKNSAEKDIGSINLVKPAEEKKDIFSRMFEGISSKVKRNQ